MVDILVKLIGWRATLVQAAPIVADRWNWLRRYLRSGPLSTLDVGCGAGEMSLYAAQQGNSVTGLSYDEYLNQIGRSRAEILRLPNVRFVTADARQLRAAFAPDERFQQIICLEMIEHILDDDRLIADLAHLLAPDGRLLLTTPNKNGYRKPGATLSQVEDGGHVRWGYTHAELRALLTKHGLKVVAEDYVSGCVSQFITRLMEVENRYLRYLAWALTFPFRLIIALDLLITKLLRFPYLSVGVVAEKSQS